MRPSSLVIRIFLVIAVVIIIAAALLFIYRYSLLQYSADTIIRNILPSYIKIDKISFEPQRARLVLRGFRILNPPEFSYRYLLEADEIICAYRMRGKNIMDGIEVLEPVLQNPVLAIERLRNGAINLTSMPQFIQSVSASRAKPQDENNKSAGWKTSSLRKGVATGMQTVIGNKTLADMVRLPETFFVKKGRLVFTDRLLRTSTTISVDSIEAEIYLKLDRSYTKVLSAGSKGEGVLNGHSREVVRWNSTYNPTTPRLTMSNRFNVSDLDIMVFKPYYDRFSPFDFRRGTFSGTLIFDFDNGNIGSTNEIRMRNLAFAVKEGAPNASLWDASVNDIARYFMTPQGEIVFDFKMKGDMASPRFYLGPISRQAITAMAVDKITQAIQQAARESASTAQGGAAEGETDMQKAAKYINLINEIMTKKK